MKKWIGRLLVDPIGTLVYGCRIAYHTVRIWIVKAQLYCVSKRLAKLTDEE